MSDEIDQIQEFEAVHLAAALSRVSAAIPAGVAGICDNCGDAFTRLVGGLCGFCRDGRLPSFDRTPIPAPSAAVEPCLDAPIAVEAATAPAPGVATAEGDTTVANPKPSKDYQAITVPATGAVLRAIRDRAEAADLPLGRAALALMKDGLSAITAESTGSLIDLDLVPLSDLLDEIRARVDVADFSDAMRARAEAAEAKLAAIAGVMAPPAADAS